MIHVHDILRERLLKPVNVWDNISLDLSGKEPKVKAKYESLEELHSWDEDFIKLMQNRMTMGSLRYGKLNKNQHNGYDNVGSVLKRLVAYQITGNTEFLVDCANLLMIEFVIGQHPLRHFSAQDDGIHTEKLK